MEKQVKISELRDIELMSTAVILCRKAMPFKSHVAIARLNEQVKAAVKYYIGKELDEAGLQIQTRIDEVAKPFRDAAAGIEEGNELKDSLVKDLNRQVNTAVNDDEQVQMLKKQISGLWNMDVLFEIEPVKIQAEAYEERFPEELKEVSLYGMSVKVDGYMCLLELIAKGVVEVEA